MPRWFAFSTRSRSRLKCSSSNWVRSNFGLPSVAAPGPVRAQGCGDMQACTAPPPTCDLNCSQRQSLMKLWPCSTSQSR